MGVAERTAAQEAFAADAREFVDYLAGVRNLSPNTVRAYATDLEAYIAWLAREGVVGQEVSHRDLRRYLAELTRAGYSTRTVNRHLSAVRDPAGRDDRNIQGIRHLGNQRHGGHISHMSTAFTAFRDDHVRAEILQPRRHAHT